MIGQSTSDTGSLISGGPAWLTISFVLIALGVIAALMILIWGARLATKRREAERALEADGAWHEGERRRAEAASPTLAPTEPVAPPKPVELRATPEPEVAPLPDTLADEPIAAATPLEASPAALAASEPEIVPAPPPPPAPAPAAPAPVAPPAPAGADDLTRLKGVGPKLAAKLVELGVTSFAQLGAMDADAAARLDAQLGNFQGRLARDRWIEQARFLAANDTAGYEAVFGKL